MNITINKAVIKEVYSDSLYKEIESYLNSVIDEELEKDDVDTDLIDECIDAIESLQMHDTAPALRLMLTEKDVVKYCKKNTRASSTAHKKAIAACLIIAMCSSAVLINAEKVTGTQIKDVFSQVISALNITAHQSTQDKQVSSIYATFPEGYSFEIKSNKDIDLSKITIYALYQDNTKSTVPIESCTVNIVDSFEGNDDKILVVIAYEGCAFSVTYTVEE